MQIDDVRRVLVLGAGRMGTEIALQCAVGGFDVLLMDVAAPALEKSAELQRWLVGGLIHEKRLSEPEAAAVVARITPTTDMQLAATADFITESAPENLKLKRDLFAKLHAICPPHTVFTTNTSYLRPQQIAAHSGRPDRFAAFHFHPPVWQANVVDILPHEGTSPEVVELLKRFAGRIGQIPIVYSGPGEGYLYNTMLRMWILSAVTLAETGTGTVEDIDRSWMGVMRSRVGPFGILDNIGLDTVGDILSFWGLVLRDEQAKRAAAFLKPYIDAGRLGLKTMRGFYEYPDAAYLRPDFLTAAMNQSTGTDALIRRFMEAGRNSLGGYSAQVAAEKGTAFAPATESPAARTQAGSPSQHDDRHDVSVPQRYLLRTQPVSVHQKLKHPVRFAGRCLIVGDNPTAAALKQKLDSLGGQVTLLPLEGTLDEILARNEALWTEAAYPHLFLLTARDDDARTQADAEWWRRRSERGVLLPYFVCQKWYSEILARSLFETATVVGATSLGGDFGAKGHVEAVEGGGIAGLLKAVYLEGAVRSSLGPQVKVVDAPLDQSPEATAEQICRELALAQASVVTGSRDESRRRYVETEVGYVRGIRHQTFAERSPLPPGSTPNFDDFALPPGSTWVITGGARGITEYVARTLARRFALRVHLLGTTILPERDYSGATGDELLALEKSVRDEAARNGRDPDGAWRRIARGIEVQRTLAEWGAEGLHATYHACDVSDHAALGATLDRVRQQDGPIAGVLHGAGLEVGAKFPEKQATLVRSTLAVKATGMAWLIDLTQNDPLQWFVTFGSLSGRFGNFAQTDYSMANELAAKQLVWLRSQRTECRAVVFHWPGWTEVGMAARAESKEGLQRGHHTFLAPEDGLAHLMGELTAESPAAEVIIVHESEVPLEMRLEPPVNGKRPPTWQRK